MARTRSYKKPEKVKSPVKIKKNFIIKATLIILCFIIVKYVSSVNPALRTKIKNGLTYNTDFSLITSEFESFKNSLLNIKIN